MRARSRGRAIIHSLLRYHTTSRVGFRTGSETSVLVFEVMFAICCSLPYEVARARAQSGMRYILRCKYVREQVDACFPSQTHVFRIGFSKMGGPCAYIKYRRFKLSYDVDAQIVKNTVRFQHLTLQNQSGNLELVFI